MLSRNPCCFESDKSLLLLKPAGHLACIDPSCLSMCTRLLFARKPEESLALHSGAHMQGLSAQKLNFRAKLMCTF